MTIRLRRVERRLASFIDGLWKIEVESHGQRRLRSLPILLLVAAHRLFESAAWRCENREQRKARR